MTISIIFALLLLFIIILLALFLISGIRFIFRTVRNKDNRSVKIHMKKNAAALLCSCLLCVAFVVVTQLIADTPSIRDENGKKPENGISELKSITLNGRKEWISIRGHNKNNPVLLFLAGGPGGSQMAAVRHDLPELEKHFIVVNWEQPGSGKSYNVIKSNKLTKDTYIEDGYELTKYLCHTFHQEKIYLVGESWGSALGIFLIDKAPELYHGFIGTGQMVSFLDTEIIDYETAMKIAGEKGDTQTVSTLESNGKPPYYGNDVTWKSAAYLQYLGDTMAANPAIHNNGYHTFRDIFSSEYGILDKINYLRGIVTTFNNVYPQLYGIDLRNDYRKVDVPVYFFLGKHDINAPLSLAEEYYRLLNAPEKELVWFEHSGHSPWINESKRFSEEVFRVFDRSATKL